MKVIERKGRYINYVRHRQACIKIFVVALFVSRCVIYTFMVIIHHFIILHTSTMPIFADNVNICIIFSDSHFQYIFDNSKEKHDKCV